MRSGDCLPSSQPSVQGLLQVANGRASWFGVFRSNSFDTPLTQGIGGKPQVMRSFCFCHDSLGIYSLESCGDRPMDTRADYLFQLIRGDQYKSGSSFL